MFFLAVEKEINAQSNTAWSQISKTRRSVGHLRLPKIPDEALPSHRDGKDDEEIDEDEDEIKQGGETNTRYLKSGSVRNNIQTNLYNNPKSSLVSTNIDLYLCSSSLRRSRNSVHPSNPRLDRLFSIVFDHNVPFVTDSLVSGLVMTKKRRGTRHVLEPIPAKQTRMPPPKTKQPQQQQTKNRIEEEDEFDDYDYQSFENTMVFSKQKSIYIDERVFDKEINIVKI